MKRKEDYPIASAQNQMRERVRAGGGDTGQDCKQEEANRDREEGFGKRKRRNEEEKRPRDTTLQSTYVASGICDDREVEFGTSLSGFDVLNPALVGFDGVTAKRTDLKERSQFDCRVCTCSS